MFPQYKECLQCLQLIHKDFQTYSVLTLCLSKKKSCYLHFLTWNYGSEIENETIELPARLRTSPFSFSFISQTEFTTFEKSLINREVPLCFWWGKRCQFIKIIPLPLHKFPSFLLVSLISSSKSRSITLDNAILILSSVSYYLMEEITSLIF